MVNRANDVLRRRRVEQRFRLLRHDHTNGLGADEMADALARLPVKRRAAVVLRYYTGSSNDLGIPPDHPEVEVVAVDVNGLEAQAWTVGGLASIQWDLGDGTSVVVDARELSTDEVTEFARGLRLQPDGLGFDATVRPQGITEIPLDQAESSTELPQRQLGLLSTDESSVVDVVVSGGDASAFEALAADRVASASSGQVEQLRVLGRPAVLAGDLAVRR